MRNLINLIILFQLIVVGVSFSQTTYTIGTATSTSSSSVVTPYATYYHDAKHQYLILASELTGQGATAGDVVSLAFDVSSYNTYTMTGFTVKLGQTALSSLPGGNFEDDATFTTCYSSNVSINNTGWFTHVFSSNFSWDGSSNIIVQVCFDNTGYSSSSTIRYSTTGFTSNVYGYEDSGSGCSQAYTSFANRGSSTSRPNMKLTIQASIPMTFTSCTVSQNNTNDVGKATVNQEIVGVEIVTTGGSSPFDATQFQINVNGTNLADLTANINIYYTGTSSTFSTTSLFGSIAPGSGTLNVNGSQTLASGTNYFWITYDIASGATSGNTVDAACTQITMNGGIGNQTPSITSPSGNRLIVDACTWKICLQDSYNDGWTGGSVEIIVDGISQGSYTLLSGASPECHNFSVTPGSSVLIDYTGGGSYVTERSYYIYDSDNVLQHSDGVSGEPADYSFTGSCPVPMTYVTSEVIQPNTNDVGIGTSNQEIIAIKVVTSGNISPLSLTQLLINMTGSTDGVNDVSNINVYYTAGSSSFAASNQLGTTQTSSSGTITFNGSQTLIAGDNFFWVAYDISGSATPSNFVDAQCTQITVGGSNETPNPTSVAGNRKIIVITACIHTIKLYDFEDNGWGTYWDGSAIVPRTVDVYVDGASVLTGLTLNSGGNGTTYNFSADHSAVISTVVNGGSSEMKYLITGYNGAFVLDDGNNKTAPIGSSGTAVCSFDRKFAVNGDAYHNTVSSADCFVLSSDIKNQNASIWCTYKVDLNQDFEVSFIANFGTRYQLAGADGIVFALQDDCSNVGGAGSDLGFGGVAPSIGIEFDTYYNSGNNDYAPSGEWDHTAIFQNGSNIHGGADELVSSIGLAQDAFANTGITDGVDYPVTIKWISSTNTLEMYWNGAVTPTITYTGDIINNIFSGSNQVYWGLTGSTGFATNLETVCITSYPNISATTQLVDDTISSGQSVQNEVAQNAFSYYWTPNDGSLDDNTIYNPTMSPTVTTTYQVMIIGYCNDTLYDEVTVYVNSLLPVSITSLNYQCFDDYINFYWNTESEINNDFFTLESSKNGKLFNQVGNINGAGNSNNNLYYSFKDYRTDNLYYRLKQTDYDGKFTYSDILIVQCSNNIEQDCIIYPSPFDKYINVDFNKNTSEKYKYSLIDCLGREIIYGELQSGQMNYFIEINEKVLNGTYLLTIYNEHILFKKLVLKQ